MAMAIASKEKIMTVKPTLKLNVAGPYIVTDEEMAAAEKYLTRSSDANVGHKKKEGELDILLQLMDRYANPNPYPGYVGNRDFIRERIRGYVYSAEIRQWDAQHPEDPIIKNRPAVTNSNGQVEDGSRAPTEHEIRAMENLDPVVNTLRRAAKQLDRPSLERDAKIYVDLKKRREEDVAKFGSVPAGKSYLSVLNSMEKLASELESHMKEKEAALKDASRQNP